MEFMLISESFRNKGMIPARYTCDGWDMSPPLFWTLPPEQTRSLALIVDDPDAPDPDAPQTTWVHWLLYNIPPDADGLPEGAAPKDLPRGTLQGKNDWGRSGYGGPCPPRGKHRYRHTLYALDTLLPDLNYPDRTTLEKAMHGHVIAQSELTGMYQRMHA
ncbi:MAG: YbhB/YbcL family Raf kinase inhibitor-like protein [Rhodocyclaceae bacterium]